MTTDATKRAMSAREDEFLTVVCLVCTGKRWVKAGNTNVRYPRRCPGCRGSGVQEVRNE